MNNKTKIFGIGLNKTGTKTLQKCGRILGYNCKSTDRELLIDIKNYEYDNVIKCVDQFNFFEDWPWPLIYAELDIGFPGSKFILTVRKNSEIWFKSLVRHSFMTHPDNHCRKLAYGYYYPLFYKNEHIKFYENHNENVRQYFQGNDNFIEVCWEDGDGWEKICNFFGKNIPNCPFPHENKSGTNKININWCCENRKRMIGF